MKYSAIALGLAAIGVMGAAPAMADTQTTAKTKTVTSVVGYVETIEYPAPIADTFAKLDRDNDGRVSFREYRNGSMVDEPYRIFLDIDTSGDEYVSIQELNDFSKTKGGAQSASRFNFNQKKPATEIN